jgi:hypothetical protein
LLQAIRCSKCQHVSYRTENFLDISLPISSTGSVKNAAKKIIQVTKHQQKKLRKQQKVSVTLLGKLSFFRNILLAMLVVL